MLSIDDIQVDKVYPPYQLDDFQRCPYLWDVKKRWEPKEVNPNLLVGGILGTAVALGLEAFYKKDGRDPVKLAEEYAAKCWGEETNLSRDGLITLARRGIKNGMKTNLGLKEILGVEQSYGRIRPDVVGRRLDGVLVVVDHKVKKSLADEYKEKTLVDFDKSNQFFEYAWGVSQEYGEAVAVVYAHLIVLAPRVYTELHPVLIDQEHLALWLQDAVQDWNDMARGEKRRRFGACNGRYGMCDFDEGCHVFHGDESKYGVLYNRKQRRF